MACPAALFTVVLKSDRGECHLVLVFVQMACCRSELADLTRASSWLSTIQQLPAVQP